MGKKKLPKWMIKAVDVFGNSVIGVERVNELGGIDSVIELFRKEGFEVELTTESGTHKNEWELAKEYRGQEVTNKSINPAYIINRVRAVNHV